MSNQVGTVLQKNRRRGLADSKGVGTEPGCGILVKWCPRDTNREGDERKGLQVLEYACLRESVHP